MTRDDDKDLQRFLDRDDELRDVYERLPKDEPPPALDAAILSAARTEAKRPVRPRWLIPMSVAATVILGVGLSTRQLSTRFETVADVSYEQPAFDAKKDAAKREGPAVSSSLEAGAPVPRPSVEELFTPSAIEDLEIRKAQVDVTELRERALAQNQAFAPPELARPQRETAPSATAEADAFVPAPPSTPEPAQEAKRAPSVIFPDLGAALDARDEVDVQRAGRRQGASEEAVPESERQYARRSRLDDADHTSRLASQTTVTVMRQVISASEADKEHGNELDATEALAIERQLAAIAALYDDGRKDLAKARFDEFIDEFPDAELPDDFPFERPPAPPDPAP